MELFAIDLGNKQTKMISRKNELVYPSFFTLFENTGESLNVFEEKQKFSKYEVGKVDEGVEYAWGKDISKVDTTTMIDTINFDNRYNTHEFKLLTSFAIAELAKDFTDAKEDILKVEIITGVPTNDFSQHIVDDLTKYLKGSHDITVDDEIYHIHVKRVSVIPQPLGTIYHKMLDDNGNLLNSEYSNQNITICDIGGGTFLIDTFKNLKLDPKQRTQKETGTHDLYDRIVKKSISDNNISGLTEYKVEQILRNPIKEKYYYKPNKNESIDITELVNKSKKLYTREVVNIFNTTLKNKGSIDTIIFTGGGSNIVDHDYIEQSLNYSTFIEDSEFANVRGYYKYGLAVNASKSKGEKNE